MITAFKSFYHNYQASDFKGLAQIAVSRVLGVLLEDWHQQLLSSKIKDVSETEMLFEFSVTFPIIQHNFICHHYIGKF
jgi:hypothetical protein